jgi:hypothetical protein
MTGKDFHTKEANAARAARGVAAVAWIESRDEQMWEFDAANLEEAKRLAVEGIANGALSASYRMVLPGGKTKVVQILSPHDDIDFSD